MVERDIWTGTVIHETDIEDMPVLKELGWM